MSCSYTLIWQLYPGFVLMNLQPLTKGSYFIFGTLLDVLHHVITETAHVGPYILQF